MMNGYLAAIATLCSWTVSAFILAKLTRLVQPGLLNKAILFFSIFLLGAVVCIIDRLNPLELFSLPDWSNWLWLGLSGIIGKSLGDYCGFNCLRILGIRRRYMIATLTPGFAFLFGYLVLNEQISVFGIIGMTITIIALLLLLNDRKEIEEVKQEKFGSYLWGVFMGLCGVALTALAFVLAKKTQVETHENISGFHGTWIRVIVAFAVVFVVDLLQRRNYNFLTVMFSDKRKTSLVFWTIVFSVILGLSFSLIAITRLEVAVAYTIFGMIPLTVLLVSVLFFREKVSWRSWLYSLLAVTGVVILVWRDHLR